MSPDLQAIAALADVVGVMDSPAREPEHLLLKLREDLQISGITCGHAAKLVHGRLIDQRVDHLPVMPADRARRMRHEHDRELLLRICPPGGAAAAPDISAPPVRA